MFERYFLNINAYIFRILKRLQEFIFPLPHNLCFSIHVFGRHVLHVLWH